MKNEILEFELLQKCVQALFVVQRMKKSSQLDKKSANFLLQKLIPGISPEESDIIYDMKDHDPNEIVQKFTLKFKSDLTASIQKAYRESMILNAAWALKGACNFPTVTENNKETQIWLVKNIIPDITEDELIRISELKVLL